MEPGVINQKTKEKLRLLVISIGPWKDESGDNTLQHIFGGYDPEQIYSLYFRSEQPVTRFCRHHFQIREYSLLKKTVCRGEVVGREVDGLPVRGGTSGGPDESRVRNEKLLADYFRRLDLLFLKLAREALWWCGGWKSPELDRYIDQSRADVIFVPVTSWIYMIRVALYAAKRTGKKIVPFFMDDNYSYKAVPADPLSRLYRCCLRRHLNKMVARSTDVLVISPKMKREYDSGMKRNTKLFTKGIEPPATGIAEPGRRRPLRFLYMGNLLYGRDKVLAALAGALKQINRNGVKAELCIYTQTEVSNRVYARLTATGTVRMMKAVPYSQVVEIQKEADFLVFPESFEKKYKRVTRLSFSTKLTDYLSSGKCVLAIGPEDISPIEYLRENGAAVVVSDLAELKKQVEAIVDENHTSAAIVAKALECCRKNHDKQVLDGLLKSVLSRSVEGREKLR